MFRSETGDLVGRAMAGDEEAKGELLERLRHRLVLWCTTRMSPKLRAKLEADDAAQEVLLKLHEDFHQFKGPRPAFYGWMFRVAENRLRDIAKYFGAQKRQPGEFRYFSQTSPSQHAALREALRRMQVMLERLEPDDQEAIRLRYLEQRGYPEIAELLECSTGAARVRVCRALGALRALMAQEDEGGGE